MRIAKLPHKDHETDPVWDSREVRKPESVLDRLRLWFVPGHWHYHIAFGWLRVVRPAKGRGG